MKIFLLGFMGSGKSTIGSLLADRLSSGYVDTDSLIEEYNGTSVTSYFDNYGEESFRKEERRVLESLSDEEDIVVGTGGGLPCNDHTIHIINQYKSFYLYLRSEDLLDRLWSQEKDQRPLIAHYHSREDLLDFIKSKIIEREKYYFQADIIIDANRSPELIIRSIQNHL